MHQDPGPARALAPEDVIPTVRGAGLISDEVLVTQGVRVEQVGRSHPVYRLSVGGTPAYYLKSFGPTRGQTDGDPARERCVAALAAERPALAAAMPESVDWAGPDRTLVTRAVAGQAAWAMDGAVEEARPEAWAALVGMAAPVLAAVHRATRDLAAPGATPPGALTPPLPWGLRLFSGDGPPDLFEQPHLAAEIHRAAADPATIRGLRAARACWRPMCLIHGDMKHDNLLVRDDGAGAVLVDWEMARIGDPCWDLAGLASHLPMISLQADGWGRATREGCAVLLRAYAGESRLPVPALARRLVLYMGAWLLMAAIQHRSAQAEDGEDGAGQLIAKAAATFAEAPGLEKALIEAAE